MQTQATFHLMPDNAHDNALVQYACVLAAQHFRQQQKVFIFAENEQQAHAVDELLWSFEPDSFVPHNLVGEGPRQGSPVEIGWQAPRGRRPVLINLTQTMPAFAGQFSQIMDFVPVAENDKQLARERFKACRQMGFNVNTQAINS
ncbi:DNA polymerase III subunit chi [Thalassotalea sp. M1531]|uniref:DNA polymerase III subunit chi n=1 Tax=Thalassotalea algicola TaxID=2716224 RepID=A0A7Y0LAS9_9GAMM|nr:DNA polymerase III subunit chi [Thalassotalea algicola]NMP30256.1 DNA polymerase III subunit chi [Thalassotalea algicola]